MINNSQSNVKFKPILNIQPSIYIPILYIILIIVIFMLISVFPGLIKNGMYLDLRSNPSNSAVYIDDIKIGYTPLNIFLKNGSYNISVKKNNFEDFEQKISVKGSVFFTLFNKKIDNYYFELKSISPDNLLKEAYENLALWALIDKQSLSKRYKSPNIFSESISDYLANNSKKTNLDSYFNSSIKLITNEYILSDYIRGLLIYNSDRKTLSPSSILNSANFINRILSEYPNSSLLIYGNILNSTESLNSNLYQSLFESRKLQIDNNLIAFESKGKDVLIDGMVFKNVPNSQITPFNVNFIHNIEQESFYILENLLPKENFFQFIQENPFWELDNKNLLINNQLVDLNYLDFEYNDSYITNISFYAAKAWCDWANTKYNIPDGYKFALPTENMWFSSLLFGVIKDNSAWQWTDSGFYLYDHYLTDKKGITINEFGEIKPRLVVGKNKYNLKSETGRGVQDADWCSPFTSFRPVLIKDK